MRARYMTMTVNHMEESVAFYRDIMGFSVDSTYEVGPDASITLLQAGDAVIELIENKAFPTGLYSIGIDVDCLDETLAHLQENGVCVIMQPVPTQVGRMAFVQDPDGVRLALIEHKK